MSGALHIGPYVIEPPLALAPMAGVTDRPFRTLCRELGAGLTASEMVTSEIRLWGSTKSRRRLDHTGEQAPRVVQIAGGDPGMMAAAAVLNAELGAEIIDINLGCPAKKVCNRAAGSALMRDEHLVRDILAAVVGAVRIPVTLKMRTGWDEGRRNAVNIARIAEDAGIAALAVHGRTRSQMFQGDAEHETTRDVVDAVSIPVFANGDIINGTRARQILVATGAAGVMIGRAALGQPWIFSELRAHLSTGSALCAAASLPMRRGIILSHLEALHGFYGADLGVRIARKHIGWYARHWPGSPKPSGELMAASDATRQLSLVARFLDEAAGADVKAA